MTARNFFHWALGVALITAFSVSASAQWSIGAPGSRQGPPGRYHMTHLSDLLQLPGWVGAQRFRIVSNLNPRPTKEGYRSAFMPDVSDNKTPRPNRYIIMD